MSNNKKKILVTGGTQGIGAATVHHLLKNGYEVHFTYRSSSKKAEEICTQYPGYAFAHKLDQGHSEEIKNAAFLTEHSWDGIVFNAALGSATVKSYAEQGDSLEAGNDEALLKVNALGPLWIYKMVEKKLLARQDHSKLIFISSVGGGINTFPCFSLSDGMSKSAVSFLARQLAAGNTHTTIDVISICPGAVETAMSAASIMSQFSLEQREAFIDTQAKKRLAQPEEFAYWIHLFLKEESVLFHGANIDASMGLGVRPGIVTEAQI